MRIWLSSPSGAWKTYSSLLIAFGITQNWSKIALIDTENWSWELYSDLWEYNVLPLKAPYSPERYIEAIGICEQDENIEVIIIDSISHEWEWSGGCLQINDILWQAKYKWNNWAAWNETTPRHQAFIEKITTSDCHVITTVRNKTDTVQEWGKVKKVWIKEQTREWFEYELTVNFNIDRDWHFAVASKDRTWLFIDRDPFVITKETWEELIKWNKSGEKIPTKQENFERIMESIKWCTEINQVHEVGDSIKKEISENPQVVTKEQLAEISKEIWAKKDELSPSETE